MQQGYFTAPRLAGQIRSGIRSGGIVVFSCHWRSTDGFPAEELVRVMCAGRIESGQILKAFEQGASGVLVLGCSGRDCHYGFGHAQAEANLRKAAGLMELLGLERERLAMVRGGEQAEKQAAEFRRSIERLEAGGGKC
jgi:coenzyme F420-reducing hydrogenase delta subunit